MSSLSIKMVYHLITHTMQITDLTVTVSALFFFLSSLLISSLLLPPTPLSKITSGRKNKHWKTLSCFGSHVCGTGLFPCSVPPDWKELELQFEGRQAACETSASFHRSWPCLGDFRQKTSVFIWRLLRHLIQLEIKGKKMCFEIEPLGRQRNQHANATRKWIQDEAWGSSLSANRSLPAQGPTKAIVKTSGEFGPVFVGGGGEGWMWKQS